MGYLCTLDLPDLVCPFCQSSCGCNRREEFNSTSERNRVDAFSTSEGNRAYEYNLRTCSGNESCSYCMEDKKKEETRPKGYVRKERWYEKYENKRVKNHFPRERKA